MLLLNFVGGSTYLAAPGPERCSTLVTPFLTPPHLRSLSSRDQVRQIITLRIRPVAHAAPTCSEPSVTKRNGDIRSVLSGMPALFQACRSLNEFVVTSQQSCLLDAMSFHECCVRYPGHQALYRCQMGMLAPLAAWYMWYKPITRNIFA